MPFLTFEYDTANWETKSFIPFYLLNVWKAETILDTMFLFCPDDTDIYCIFKNIYRDEESKQNFRFVTLKAEDRDYQSKSLNIEKWPMLPGDLI